MNTRPAYRPFSLLLLLPFAAMAQVSVDKPILLEGATPAQQQVNGLSNAGSEDDALNARTLQAAGYVYAAAGVGDDWTVQLDPPASTLAAGTRLMVRANDGNTGPVTLTIDALGPFDLVKNGDLPLDTGDVNPGEVCAVLFDGTVFHLLSSRRTERRPCPSGYAQVNELYCIGIASNDTMPYLDAVVFCGSQDARLCTWGEWYVACTKTALLGLQSMIGDWEWTNDAANSDGSIRMVGYSSCTHAGVTNAYTSVIKSRCCFHR